MDDQTERHGNPPHTITSSLAAVSPSKNSGDDATAEDMHEQAILVVLVRLSAHYWRPDYKPAQSREMWLDWIADLREFDIVAIEAACESYRRNSTSEFFPKPGQLRTLAALEQKEVRERAKFAALPPPQGSIGSRPIMWWAIPRARWKPHWLESEVPRGERPSRHESPPAPRYAPGVE